jgi:hypothetical protein
MTISRRTILIHGGAALAASSVPGLAVAKSDGA